MMLGALARAVFIRKVGALQMRRENRYRVRCYECNDR